MVNYTATRKFQLLSKTSCKTRSYKNGGITSPYVSYVQLGRNEFRSTVKTLKSCASETEITVGKKLGSAAKGHREARSSRSRLENSRNNEPVISSLLRETRNADNIEWNGGGEERVTALSPRHCSTLPLEYIYISLPRPRATVIHSGVGKGRCLVSKTRDTFKTRSGYAVWTSTRRERNNVRERRLRVIVTVTLFCATPATIRATLLT